MAGVTKHPLAASLKYFLSTPHIGLTYETVSFKLLLLDLEKSYKASAESSPIPAVLNLPKVATL